MSSRFNREAYCVAWIAPLPFEASAALLLLDEHHEALEPNPGQTTVYHLGRIADHYVVIAGFPVGEIGIGVAASIVTEIQRDFPALEVALLVGIGAGIPCTENDIFLGDVAVAVPEKDHAGVIGYDMVKASPEKIELKQWQNATHPRLRSAISAVQSLSLTGSSNFRVHLMPFQDTPFKRPTGSPAVPAFRSPERPLRHEPTVHYGCILSGNRVVKDAMERDRLRQTYNAIAIEMEAAGMMNILPAAVIRGISDFADADKGDEWQYYAAATSSAYAKELLLRLPPRPRTSNMALIPKARMPLSDLYSLLDRRAEQKTQKLDWRNSVVDLLKVLDLESSPAARSRLARRWKILVGEDGSAVQNIAIHGVVLDELAKNCGAVPNKLIRALSADGQIRL